MIARHESSNQCPITLQSSSPPPSSSSGIPPTQLHRSSVSNSLCLNHNILGLSKHQAIAFLPGQLLLKQTFETSFKESTRVPRPRPSSQSSRRACGDSDLHSPDTAHNPCPSASPNPNASYVQPRSGSLFHLQQYALQAPHKADSYVSSLVRRCLRTWLGHGIDG